MKIIFVQKKKEAPPGFESNIESGIDESSFKNIKDSEFLNIQRRRAKSFSPDETYFRISRKTRGELTMGFTIGNEIFEKASSTEQDRVNVLMDENDPLKFMIVFSPDASFKMSFKNPDVVSFTASSPARLAHEEYASNVSKKCQHKIIGHKKIFIDATNLKKEVIPHECS